MPKFLSDSPVMKLKRAAGPGVWWQSGVGVGSTAFPQWVPVLPQLLRGFSLLVVGPNPAEEMLLHLLLSKLRHNHQGISATCLVGRQALVPAAFSVCYQEQCWPPPFEIIMKNSTACSLPLLWLPRLLLRTQLGSSCCSGAFSSTLLLWEDAPPCERE